MSQHSVNNKPPLIVSVSSGDAAIVVFVVFSLWVSGYEYVAVLCWWRSQQTALASQHFNRLNVSKQHAANFRDGEKRTY